jgi:hypothetical protein
MTCDHKYKDAVIAYRCLDCGAICMESDWSEGRWRTIGNDEEVSRLKLQLAATMRDYGDTVQELMECKKRLAELEESCKN